MITRLQADILYAMVELIKKNSCDNVCKEINAGEEQHIGDTVVCTTLNELAERGLITKHNQPNQKIQVLKAGIVALKNFWYAEERYM